MREGKGWVESWVKDEEFSVYLHLLFLQIYKRSLICREQGTLQTYYLLSGVEFKQKFQLANRTSRYN